MEFLAVLCVMVLLTPGISAASSPSLLQIRHRRRNLNRSSAPQQTPPPAAAPAPPSADQLPAPREAIHFAPYEPLKSIEGMSSTYIPLDSWIYPAVMRLYGLGFVDTVFLGMRPVDASERRPHAGSKAQTGSPAARAMKPSTFIPPWKGICSPICGSLLIKSLAALGLDSVYRASWASRGTPLRDSFHLGQTDINDFGRPYAGGFNSYTGFSARGHYGMFSIYFRGEFQHAPSWEGYSASALSEDLGHHRRFRHL